MATSERLRAAPLVLLVVTAAGCFNPLRKTHPDLPGLMDAYRHESAAALARQDSLEHARLGRVEIGGSGNERTLTVDVRDAPLGPLTRRVLDATQQPFVYEGVSPAGLVTARFADRPLVEGLNLLLVPHGFSASVRDGLLVVRAGPPATPPTAPGPGGPGMPVGQPDMVQSDVAIEHLDAKAAGAIVDGFLRGGQLRAVYNPAKNVVYLWGPPRDVSDATAMIRRADRPTEHVLIEALVVEFDVETMRQLAASVSGLQIGNISQLFLVPGNVSGAALQFMRQYGVTNAKQFVAVVQALAGTDKARVVARPYISARSGELATVDIGRQKFYLTQQFQQGLLTAGATMVPSGITLKITPTALPGERVRVDLHVEESQFIPTTDNAASETDKTMAETSMQVPNGQTIVIGGMTLDRQSRTNSGIPILRHIPLLNLLASQQGETGKNQEIMVFITPHIWDPSMTPPLAAPGAFGAQDDARGIRP